jgi:hypothetical protein
MQEIELTWVRIVKMWWLMLWRGLLIILPVSFVAGATIGAVSVILNAPFAHDPAKMRLAGQIAGMLVSIPVYLLVLRMALRKKYRDFRLAAVPPDSPKLG